MIFNNPLATDNAIITLSFWPTQVKRSNLHKGTYTKERSLIRLSYLYHDIALRPHILPVLQDIRLCQAIWKQIMIFNNPVATDNIIVTLSFWPTHVKRHLIFSNTPVLSVAWRRLVTTYLTCAPKVSVCAMSVW